MAIAGWMVLATLLLVLCALEPLAEMEPAAYDAASASAVCTLREEDRAVVPHASASALAMAVEDASATAVALALPSAVP